jgi:phage tail-like protein
MNIPIKIYRFREDRLRHACGKGFTLNEQGQLVLSKEELRHTVFFGMLDSIEFDNAWGRLTLKAQIPEDGVLVIRVTASNEGLLSADQGEVLTDDFLLDQEIPESSKEKLFLQRNCMKFINQRNALLYGLSGRYLWIYLEVIGGGEGYISELSVDSPGDNFMQTFPEIYQENGGFFHRYLSIFSSIYMDFQKKIENIHEILDINTAPAQLLPMFGEWLGLINSPFLEEERQRKLIRMLPQLNELKGSRRAVILVAELLAKSKVLLIERSRLQDFEEPEERRVYERLYGDSSYDFTLLISHAPEERLHAQLLFLINQYTPARSRANIVFLKTCGSMDSYCYLDINARMHSVSVGTLDHNRMIDGSVILN